MQYKAFAKINWSLDILGQRPDGYHLMDMVMQPVSVCDLITLEPDDALTLTVSGDPYIAPDAHHLALRAAQALRAYTGCTRGAHLHVHKQIPAQAGLGGGSSDAAAVLLGLNKLWELELTMDELCRLALSLGADIPFCLTGGLQRVQGIGEVLQPQSFAPAYPLLIIKPCEGLSTRRVFEACGPDGARLSGQSAGCAPRAQNSGAGYMHLQCAGTGLCGHGAADPGCAGVPALAWCLLRTHVRERIRLLRCLPRGCAAGSIPG